jgi:ABC-2 type transport system permease protein
MMSNNLNRIYWVAFITILRRETYRIFWIWPQTLVPPVVTMSLYFVIFGELIGQRIGEINGVPYITYLVPGLVMMSVITNSYGNVVSSFFSARFQRQIEEILVAPVPSRVLLLAYVMGGVMRGLLVGSIVMGVARFFTPVPIHHIGVVIGIFILTASLFSLAGFINAIFAKNFDDISIVPTFILTPLTYLGGVFYSIELLPEFWQWMSLLNPILYMVNGFRYGILGTSDIAVEWAFLLVILFNILGYYYAIYLLEKGVGLRS